MKHTQKIIAACTGLALCTLTLFGCSGDQEKKQEKKPPTVQQKIGQDAAQSVQKPLEEARKAARAETGANQAVKDAADNMQPAAPEAGGKEKKKLEGC